MRIYVTSVLVDDQAKALKFYTDTLGFIVKNDVPVGDDRWLTVVSQEDPEGTELLHEPSGHPAAKPYKDALVKDRIPATSFQERGICKTSRAWGRVHDRANGCGPCANGGFRRHLRESHPAGRNETRSITTQSIGQELPA